MFFGPLHGRDTAAEGRSQVCSQPLQRCEELAQSTGPLGRPPPSIAMAPQLHLYRLVPSGKGLNVKPELELARMPLLNARCMPGCTHHAHSRPSMFDSEQIRFGCSSTFRVGHWP